MEEVALQPVPFSPKTSERKGQLVREAGNTKVEWKGGQRFRNKALLCQVWGEGRGKAGD